MVFFIALFHKVSQRLHEANRRRIAIRFSLTVNRNLQYTTHNLQNRTFIRLFGNPCNQFNQWQLFNHKRNKDPPKVRKFFAWFARKKRFSFIVNPTSHSPLKSGVRGVSFSKIG